MISAPHNLRYSLASPWSSREIGHLEGGSWGRPRRLSVCIACRVVLLRLQKIHVTHWLQGKELDLGLCLSIWETRFLCICFHIWNMRHAIAGLTEQAYYGTETLVHLDPKIKILCQSLIRSGHSKSKLSHEWEHVAKKIRREPGNFLPFQSDFMSKRKHWKEFHQHTSPLTTREFLMLKGEKQRKEDENLGHNRRPCVPLLNILSRIPGSSLVDP